MKRKDFECKGAMDYGADPYHQLSPTGASGDLMNPNPVV